MILNKQLNMNHLLLFFITNLPNNRRCPASSAFI